MSTEEFSFMCANKLGLYTIDKFYLEAKARLISKTKIKKQCHARKYTLSFYVFQKNDKIANKTDYFKLLDEYTNTDLEHKIWELK